MTRKLLSNFVLFFPRYIKCKVKKTKFLEVPTVTKSPFLTLVITISKNGLIIKFAYMSVFMTLGQFGVRAVSRVKMEQGFYKTR